MRSSGLVILGHNLTQEGLVATRSLSPLKLKVPPKRRLRAGKHHSTSSSTRPPKTSRRVVRFSLSTIMSKPAGRSLNPSGWYSKKEIRDMKRKAKELGLSSRNRCANTEVLMDVYNFDEMDILRDAALTLKENCGDDEFRGLEIYGSEGHWLSRSLSVCWARTEVLVAQAEQTISGLSDPSKIAMAYSKASQRAVKFARVLGCLDETSKDS